MYIFKIAKVISENVRIAFLYVLSIYTGRKIKAIPFEWCIQLYSIILTYLVTDFEKDTLIYTVYIFIRIKKKYFNKVRKVRCTF